VAGAVSALVVEAAVAIAAAAIESGPLEAGDVDGELARPVVTGITTAIGFCTRMVASTGVAAALASVDWLASVELELLSACEVSLLFEPSDFVLLPPLVCVDELPLSLLLLLVLLLAAACELAGLLLLAGGLFAWFWLAAEAACELLLLGVLRLGDELSAERGNELSVAERCGGGGGGGGSCAGGGRLEESEDRLLLTSEAKLLASCEASGRADLSAALGGAL
jgi:hypothetical protein